MADAPAVGSGAPQTEFIADGWEPSSSSKIFCAVGKICCGNSLIRYCANFWSCSRLSLDKDSDTGALRITVSGWKLKKYRPISFLFNQRNNNNIQWKFW